MTGRVYVVDDDAALREALEGLFRSVGYDVTTCASAKAFLDLGQPVRPACLVVDVRMPGMSGLDLQAELGRRQTTLPIIMITGHGDVPMCAAAMRAGAVDFLLKPFREQDLLDAVSAGIVRDSQHCSSEQDYQTLKQRLAGLSPREREVMTMVVEGHPNKVIAAHLDLSEITIKLSRGLVMRKMAAASLPALVRIADRLGISPRRPS